MDVNVTLQDVTATLKIEAAPPEPPTADEPRCCETDGEFLRYHGYVFRAAGRGSLARPERPSDVDDTASSDPGPTDCDGWTIGPFTFGTDELGPPKVPKRR